MQVLVVVAIYCGLVQIWMDCGDLAEKGVKLLSDISASQVDHCDVGRGDGQQGENKERTDRVENDVSVGASHRQFFEFAISKKVSEPPSELE